MSLRRIRTDTAAEMTDGTPPTAASVTWRHVGLFYGIALGGAIVVALVIWGLRQVLGGAATVPGLAVVALLYMPLPLLAGLIVEKVLHRRPLLAHEWQALRTGFWRTFSRNVVVAVVLIVVIVLASFAVAWVAGTLGIGPAGHLVTSQSDLYELLAQAAPGVAVGSLPPVGVFAAGIIAVGVVAGVTVNALFAFGEEYGWRGVLAEELRPLGRFRATLLTGIMWGFWHAPIIMLGHNYGASWPAGIVVMATWTVPLSFLLTWARERTGSVIAPAMLHGAFNGVVGVFVYLIIGGNVLVRFPVGLLMSLTLTALALVVWRLPVPATLAPTDTGPGAPAVDA